jgi:hypothetical protein
MVMKTTIEIEDALLKQAKQLAVEHNLSLKAVVELALRRFLEETNQQPGTPFKLRDHTFGGRGVQPGLDEHDWPTIRAMVYEGRGG